MDNEHINSKKNEKDVPVLNNKVMIKYNTEKEQPITATHFFGKIIPF